MKYKLFLALVLLILPLLVLAEGFERDLYFGLRNDPDVASLQSFLQERGLYSGPVNGNFFSLTKEAVKKLQIQEKITPAVGYFGAKTRARVVALLETPISADKAPAALGQPSASVAPSKESILAQIQELQARLSALQAKLAAERATTTTPVAATSTLFFSKKPVVASSGFISYPPLGAHYPYRVTFDWDTNATGAFEEFIYHSPILKTAKQFARIRSTEYYPEPHTNYSVSVEVKNNEGAKTTEDFTFSTPNWVSVSGRATSTFPAIESAFFKIGEFTVYNGSSSDVLFANFETEVVDEMDSVFNRNRKVNFLLRDGVQSSDTLISSTDFTFIQTAPKIGEPHISPLNLAFDVRLKPGEKKVISFWIEQMKYVRSGTLQVRSTKTVMTADTITITGKWNFALTREPSL